jgi:hypothetical protein
MVTKMPVRIDFSMLSCFKCIACSTQPPLCLRRLRAMEPIQYSKTWAAQTAHSAVAKHRPDPGGSHTLYFGNQYPNSFFSAFQPHRPMLPAAHSFRPLHRTVLPTSQPDFSFLLENFFCYTILQNIHLRLHCLSPSLPTSHGPSQSTHQMHSISYYQRQYYIINSTTSPYSASPRPNDSLSQRLRRLAASEHRSQSLLQSPSPLKRICPSEYAKKFVSGV